MLDIDMQFRKGILIVRLKGILDIDTANLLKDELDDIVRTNGIRYVLLNLKSLDYIDYYGLSVIKNSYDYIKSLDGKLILCGINKLFDYNNAITDNLYQINEEVNVYDIVNI